MTSADSSSSKQSAGGSGDADTLRTRLSEINWKGILLAVLVALVVIAAAVVLLLGLPLGAVWIMNTSNCCFAEGAENTITFWAALIAGFLALFGMLITGVFIITAFKVDASARVVAEDVSRRAADEAVDTYLRRYKAMLFEEIEKMKMCVEKHAEGAKQAITEAQRTVETLRDAASSAITNARDATTEAADAAKQEMGVARRGVEALRDAASSAITSARDATTEAAAAAEREIGDADRRVEAQRDDATAAIDIARDDVEDLRGEAVGAIGKAREEVESAASAAQERINRATRDLSPPEDEPRRPDE